MTTERTSLATSSIIIAITLQRDLSKLRQDVYSEHGKPVSRAQRAVV